MGISGRVAEPLMKGQRGGVRGWRQGGGPKLAQPLGQSATGPLPGPGVTLPDERGNP
ncbi:hypothetical protein STRIP9103_02840 [Streptomyces ipomoeae 91-03]|uniref:Uncharacterized protein n=1 Tax=Streptomyces ipomoeae 91-03 TaxID=698759 RepID=L1L2W4_9ACTN|nr:hypothetical protein STRIP9103_02840 [Streptomyces ipomoeae 91-03]